MRGIIAELHVQDRFRLIAKVHHSDSICSLGNNAQIMGNKQQYPYQNLSLDPSSDQSPALGWSHPRPCRFICNQNLVCRKPSRSSLFAAYRRTIQSILLKSQSGIGIPTRSSISTRQFFGLLDIVVCIINCSTIWAPIVIAGAKLAIGSWKIIEIAPPRTTTSSR